MTRDNKVVHCVWVGSDLGLLERLSISLLQSHGHEVHLWTYKPLNNVPLGVIVRAAAEILPEKSIFRYRGQEMSCLPSGGIGSLSHWSDQFQLKLLDTFGGIYTQLDVAYLEPISFENPYAMPVWLGENNNCIAPYVMKCPSGGKFTREAYERASKALHENSNWENVDWNMSMRIMGETLVELVDNVEDYMIDLSSVWDLGCSECQPFFKNIDIPIGIKMIHWSNATVSHVKNNPLPDSTYWHLLKKMQLI